MGNNRPLVMMILVVVLILVLGLGAYGGKTWWDLKRSQSQNPIEQVVVAKPDEPTPPPQPIALSSDNVSVYIPLELVADAPTDGPVITLERADLVGQGAQAGTISRLYDSGRFMVAVQANLPPPPDGMVYKMWLEKAGDQNRVLAGTLVQSGEEYQLEAQANKYLVDYTKVVVTKNLAADELAGEVVAEGQF